MPAGREPRPLVGTAARSAASGGSLFSFTPRRPGNADLRSAPLREAQRDGGSLLSFTTRRSGNADLRSAPLRARWRIALFDLRSARRARHAGGNADLRSAPLREAQRHGGSPVFPTGIARERETSADDAARERRQRHATPARERTTSGGAPLRSRSERRPAELFHGTRAREGRVLQAALPLAGRRNAKRRSARSRESGPSGRLQSEMNPSGPLRSGLWNRTGVTTAGWDAPPAIGANRRRAGSPSPARDAHLRHRRTEPEDRRVHQERRSSDRHRRRRRRD